MVYSLLEEGAPSASGRKKFILATQGKPGVNPGLSFLSHFRPWMGGNRYLTMKELAPEKTRKIFTRIKSPTNGIYAALFLVNEFTKNQFWSRNRMVPGTLASEWHRG